MGIQLNEDRSWMLLITIDVASVSANTTAEQTFTVNGLRTTDFVEINKPTHSAGLGIVNVRCSAANTLAVTFMNSTGSPIDPAAEIYQLWVERPEKTYSSVPLER